jgi:OmpA-OmpF porin, OOP family
MRALCTLPCLVFAATATFCLPSGAQLLPGAPATATQSEIPSSPPRGVWLPGGRSYLGLNLGRSKSTACNSTDLTCESAQPPAQFYTGTMFGNFWGVELAYSNAARLSRAAGDAPAQGLTFSVLGKTQLTPSLGLYGKLGTTYGRGDATALSALRAAGGADRGFGLAFGAGLSYEFTPRLSATLQWDTTETPVVSGGRDPVRSTSLGLKYRY